MSATQTHSPNTVPHWLAVAAYTFSVLLLAPMILGFAATLVLCIGPFILAGMALGEIQD